MTRTGNRIPGDADGGRMSDGHSPERIAAIWLAVLITLQPIVGVAGATATAAGPLGGRQDTPASGARGADPGETYDGDDVAASEPTGSFASLPGGMGTADAMSTVDPELGQATTPTATPSPVPTTAPGTPVRSPNADGPDPVLVLLGLITVVLLALGVWFLLR